MPASTLFPSQAQADKQAEQPPPSPEPTLVKQFNGTTALPEAAQQAPEQMRKVTLQDFEPPQSVLAGFAVHKEKG